MKLFLYIFWISCLFFSCKKDDNNRTNSDTVDYTIRIRSSVKAEFSYTVQIFKKPSNSNSQVMERERIVQEGEYYEITQNKPMDEIIVKDVPRGRQLSVSAGHTSVQEDISVIILRNDKEVYNKTSDWPINYYSEVF